MKLTDLFKKIRKTNRGQYQQFIICISFAILLISAFSGIINSQFIKNTLPEGGDTQKLVNIIFTVALVGCFIFSIYSISLFLRYKSREIGVFLALGTNKKILGRTLYQELIANFVISMIAGIILGNIAAFIIGTIFSYMIPEVNRTTFTLSAEGMIIPFFFSITLLIILLFLAIRFMKRSNVMDVINEQRKSEPLKKSASTFYGVMGVVLLVGGISLASVLPVISVYVFKRSLGGLGNVFYLCALAGLYMIMVYSMSGIKKGRNPGRYYKHMISSGILKFQGASVVRNMLVISLLLFSTLFSLSYIPMKIVGADKVEGRNRYQLSYPRNADELEEKDIYALAEEYGVKLSSFNQLTFLQLLGDGVERDYDDHKVLIEDYKKEFGYQAFISESQYNDQYQENQKIAPGTYKMIVGAASYENVWSQFGDLSYAANPEGQVAKELSYDGNVINNELVVGYGFDSNARYIISDEDYSALEQGLSDEHHLELLFFDLEEGGRVNEFSKELFKRYCLLASENMKVMGGYDEHQYKQALANGEDYVFTGVELQPDHPEAYLDWKYTPKLGNFSQQMEFLSEMTFYLLFIFVAAICLSAVTVISITRSITIGLMNKPVFEDIMKLGADKIYIIKLIKEQVRKIYVLPTMLGVVLVSIFQIFISLNNNRSISKGEVLSFGICFLIALGVCLFQFAIYSYSLKKVKRLVGV